MKFGPLPTKDAAGTILAHAMALPKTRFKKGRVLSKADIECLVDAGVESVIVAQLTMQDMEENEAAQRVAACLTAKNISDSEPFTGRVNLYAKQSGAFFASKEGVDEINRIDPGITLATLENGTFVEAGRMVATVKIIPFAVDQNYVVKAEQISRNAGILTLRDYRPRRVGLVATKLPSLKPSTMDKTARVLEDRLKVSGSQLVREERVEHTAEKVSSAIISVADDCDLIILFGASAITDRQDVLPTGIELAGGRVETFGMPVDPGNLLLTGVFGGTPVIGAPGCARSPAENGFDWVLQRILAGLNVDEEYITGLGVGGLLKEISARPQPRDG